MGEARGDQGVGRRCHFHSHGALGPAGNRGPWQVGSQAAGLHASVIPWLRRRDVALVGSDHALDVQPAGVPGLSGQNVNLGVRPVHDFVLIYLGTNVFDNCDLEALAEAAAARKRWEFLVTAAPLPTGGTGSPINPVAIF